MKIHLRREAGAATLVLILSLRPVGAFSQEPVPLQPMQASSTSGSAVAEEAEVNPAMKSATTSSSVAAGGKGRVGNYFYDTFGPGTWIAAGILAGRDQGRNRGSNTKLHGEPPEWGQGAEGYGDRYASRFGQVVISQTVRYSTGALLHEDVIYHRCQCTGLLPRMTHVFVGSYTATTSSGSTVFSLPNLVGPLAAGQIAVAGWYPSRFDQRQGLRLAVPQLMGGPIRNAVREFLGR